MKEQKIPDKKKTERESDRSLAIEREETNYHF